MQERPPQTKPFALDLGFKPGASVMEKLNSVKTFE